MSAEQTQAALQQAIAAAKNPSYPLTEADYQNIVSALQLLALNQPHIDRAKQAGVDVSAVQAQADAQRTQLLAMKNIYFPGR